MEHRHFRCSAHQRYTRLPVCLIDLSKWNATGAVKAALHDFTVPGPFPSYCMSPLILAGQDRNSLHTCGIAIDLMLQA